MGDFKSLKDTISSLITNQIDLMECILMDEVPFDSSSCDYNMQTFPIHADDKKAVKLASIYKKTFPEHKMTRKHITSTYVEDMELQKNIQDDNTTVLCTKLVSWGINGKWLVLTFKRQYVPVHQFPSCRDIHDHVDIKRVSFKGNNDVSFNIDSCQYEDNTVSNHVYISTNIGKQSIDEQISAMINSMQVLQTV